MDIPNTSVLVFSCFFFLTVLEVTTQSVTLQVWNTLTNEDCFPRLECCRTGITASMPILTLLRKQFGLNRRKTCRFSEWIQIVNLWRVVASYLSNEHASHVSKQQPFSNYETTRRWGKFSLNNCGQQVVTTVDELKKSTHYNIAWILNPEYCPKAPTRPVWPMIG